MSDFIILKDGEVVGSTSDRDLAERLTDFEVVTDGMYERATYNAVTAEELTNE